MGCIFYDYDYTQEMENKNFSITIISNTYNDKIIIKTKKQLK